MLTLEEMDENKIEEEDQIEEEKGQEFDDEDNENSQALYDKNLFANELVEDEDVDFD